MIALFISMALANTPQEVHELEWQRQLPIAITVQAAGANPDVRASVAIALGRLHSSDALSFLQPMMDDADRGVQVAVADALGWTPGAHDDVRRWLNTQTSPQGFAARRASVDGLEVHLIEALGRQAEAEDVPLLLDWLDTPWPTGAAAARALGRLGRRGVSPTEDAVDPLVRCLSRPDPRMPIACAYGLRRMGMHGASAAAIQAAERYANHGAKGAARADLVTALWPILDAEARTDLFITAIGDRDARAKVAGLNAVEPDQVPMVIVETMLVSEDPWVASAAIDAVGRLGGLEALQGRMDPASPWLSAQAIRAAGDPLGVSFDDMTVPLPMRAAVLEVARLTAEDRIAIAKTSPEPTLRTSAIVPLLDKPTSEVIEALLGADDPVVREAAIEGLGELPIDVRLPMVTAAVRREMDGDLLASLFELLIEPLAQPSPPKVDKEVLEPAILRAWHHPIARVSRAAERLGALIELSLPERQPLHRRVLSLPDGTSKIISAAAPNLADTLTVRGARVRTSRGEFVLSLDPDVAPLAVANFALLAESGFYDGLVVHRMVPGFVVQTGCPRGDGWGGPGWTLPDEVSSTAYAMGALGMARSAPWDTGGSQWFITTSATPHLEGDYTWFGALVQGKSVVRSLRVGDVIESVTLERVSR